MRYLPLISFLLLLCWHTEVSSQSCLPEGITFTTQSQIDSFQINYPGCTEIEGYAIIEGSDICDLNGLNTITSFGGGLRVSENDSLVDLLGLDNVTSIVGNLIIVSNPLLVNLMGLENLLTGLLIMRKSNKINNE